ncbi:sugar 3,4-ketoisomerase [Haliscomenobacter hydrossis]|uniref:WxcM-like domain-containing protein n=1 Tax=Haliscomenobacter hydrossis (strain ATCC 27775 / DSM 1100 / LMG 10767 / O) TaxID=760192 RepID=F4KTA0_HALH1|nr:FdtA/QdtA family cupin domain-containing protein [Haliscomenobacter hydrossis]AEE51157.1 WxcM-like domain-containing protein [Haliscomenobacter hydrossis DSM 1100]
MVKTQFNPGAPQLIEFPTHGESAIGYLAVAQMQQDIPFVVKRIFWTYFTPQSVIRGRHAHHATSMVLIAVHGRIEVQVEMLDGHKSNFLLDRPDHGVFLPPLTWHTMQYSHDAVQVVLTDTEYTSEDYIRSYEEFVGLRRI